MTSWLKLPEKSRPTLGIITFNSQQQSLILDLLDEARRSEPELEWFFADDRIEPTIVKNLENVQGDERDVILFSIGFWKDASGKPPPMDFGALNRDGGERRLNVAVTRARQELIIFSGFTADQIVPERSKARAVRDLKTFLDYAERGAIALPAQDAGSVGGFDSPFEEAVAAQLERRGWQIIPQVGISGFRIDLGVRHPDRAGAYLAGVECDGASYHSSATARDRDKVREQVLRGLGWNIVRVWSTDWWFDAKGCAERLHDTLTTLLQESRDKQVAQDEREKEQEKEHEQNSDATSHWDMGQAADPTEQPVSNAPDEAAMAEEDGVAPPVIQTERIARAPVTTAGAPPQHASQPTPPPSPQQDQEDKEDKAGEEDNTDKPPTAHERFSAPEGSYRITDLSQFNTDPEQFHEFGYRNTLRAMIDEVMNTESPIRTDILAQRIARAHGWLRTGGRIRERLDLHLRDMDRTVESSGEFIWKKGSVTEFLDYRPPADEHARRGVADIPLAELASVVVANPALLDQTDPVRDFARLLGIERLAAISRSRLAEAIGRAKAYLSTTQPDA